MPEVPLSDRKHAVAGVPGRGKTRLVFIQVSGADIAHVCRDIAVSDCDVAVADDADQAMTCFADRAPDLLICPLAIWCEQGQRLAGALAQRCPRRPLLMLLIPGCATAPMPENGRLACAGLSDQGLFGALRFVTNPGAPPPDSMLGPHPPGITAGSRLAQGDIEIDLATCSAFRAGRPLRLAFTGFRLLHALMEQPNRVRTREYLMARMRGTRHYIADRTIDVHISRLRSALNAHGGHDVIHTVRGVGYAFRID